jgi:hypothetical protein
MLQFSWHVPLVRFVMSVLQLQSRALLVMCVQLRRPKLSVQVEVIALLALLWSWIAPLASIAAILRPKQPASSPTTVLCARRRRLCVQLVPIVQMLQ